MKNVAYRVTFSYHGCCNSRWRAGSKDIAQTTNISVKTVETHRLHIMTKVGAHNVASLTKYAIREGLTSLEE